MPEKYPSPIPVTTPCKLCKLAPVAFLLQNCFFSAGVFKVFVGYTQHRNNPLSKHFTK